MIMYLPTTSPRITNMTTYTLDSPDIRYCEMRFKSYDPVTRTYLGYDGRRHPVPVAAPRPLTAGDFARENRRRHCVAVRLPGGQRDGRRLRLGSQQYETGPGPAPPR